MRGREIIEQDLLEIYNSGIDWTKFQTKSILITGANGFLPAYIVETLLYANAASQLNLKVIALVRNADKAQKRFARHAGNTALHILSQDVCEPVNLDEKIDFIIHAASQASPKYYGTDPVGTLLANITGTMNLLELARKNKPECFLFFSSAEVYGQQADGGKALTEDSYGYLDPMKVRACYAESKRMGENICVSYLHQYGINTRIVRPFHTFGPGMDLQDGRVFVDFVANIVNGDDIVMKSDGLAKRAYCYITDAIEAYLKILLFGQSGEAYNVGNPYNIFSVLELGNMLVDMFQEKGLKVVKQEQAPNPGYLASQIDSVVPDITKSQQLNWTPKISAREGFHRTVMSYY